MRRSIALASAVLTLAACGSSTKAAAPAPATAATTTSAAAMADKKLSAAYCTTATAIGSITKARTAAMDDGKAMGADKGMKMFEDLQGKVTSLAAAAPADLKADIATIAGHVALEATAEGKMKADGTGGETEMKMMDDHKAVDDAATKHVIDATKAGCNVDLS